MAAYEYFAETATNTFIEHVKTKAEAYGWSIDYYAAGRVHLHNADGAHFEIYASGDYAAIRGCTGYSSESGSTNQPGVSGPVLHYSRSSHFIVVGPHSIFIKSFVGSGYHNIQFGYINDKIGSWDGGICISYAHTTTTSGYYYALWGFPSMSNVSPVSQVLINGTWTPLAAPATAGAIVATVESELYAKMPFAYSGGILPCPLLLTQRDFVTTTYFHPIGYAPDVRFFNGGSVYTQLQEIMIDGETWIGINQTELNGTFVATPNILIRLAA